MANLGIISLIKAFKTYLNAEIVGIAVTNNFRAKS